MFYRFKMVTKKPILFRIISILAKTWKNSFPKEFFNEIWLRVEELESIYITEIALKKSYSVLIWRPKYFLILCNYANLCELARKRRGRFNFFQRQKKRIL